MSRLLIAIPTSTRLHVLPQLLPSMLKMIQYPLSTPVNISLLFVLTRDGLADYPAFNDRLHRWANSVGKDLESTQFRFIERATEEEKTFKHLFKSRRGRRKVPTIAKARETVRSYVLENDFDYVLFNDIDQVLPEYTIERLLRHMKQADLAGGLVPDRYPPKQGMFFIGTAEDFTPRPIATLGEIKRVSNYRRYLATLQPTMLHYVRQSIVEREPIEVVQLGIGVALIKREALRQASFNYGWRIVRIPPMQATMAFADEDPWFSLEAKMEGFRLVVDPIVCVGHIADDGHVVYPNIHRYERVSDLAPRFWKMLSLMSEPDCLGRTYKKFSLAI